MKLYLQSDLHLEHYPFVPPDLEADVVALVGDIGSHTQGLDWAIRTFGARGLTILYVAGNHEFYGTDLPGLLTELQHTAASARGAGVDVWVLENSGHVCHGVRFLGATLWTDYQLFGPGAAMAEAMNLAARRMNDHQYIHCAPPRLLTPADTVAQHEQSVAWLRQALATPFAGPTVVLTHHLPSLQSVAPQFRQQVLTAAFASHLDDLVQQADYWLHGHTHISRDYRLGRARVLCNPRGYRRMDADGLVWENPDWDPGLILAIASNESQFTHKRPHSVPCLS